MMNFLDVNHKVSGSVEHSFKLGSGEELRGIEVDGQRAVAAYQRALADLDAFFSVNKESVERIDAETTRKTEEINEKYRAMGKERDAKRAAAEAKSDRRRELEKKSRRFWGLSKAEQREFAAIPAEGSMYDHFLWRYELEEQRHELLYLPRPGLAFKLEHDAMSSKLGVALVAANTLYMTRCDVLEIHAIETGKWLPSTKLALALAGITDIESIG